MQAAFSVRVGENDSTVRTACLTARLPACLPSQAWMGNLLHGGRSAGMIEDTVQREERERSPLSGIAAFFPNFYIKSAG